MDQQLEDKLEELKMLKANVKNPGQSDKAKEKMKARIKELEAMLEDKLEEAVERCVDSWDIDTLMNFAIDEMFDYYVSADEQTVKQFIREQLGESNG